MHIVKMAALVTLLWLPSSVLLAAEESSRLQVQAEASVDTAPDKATINASLWEKTPDFAVEQASGSHQDELNRARETLEERTAKLLGALADAGIARSDIHAGSLTVQPETLPSGDDRDAPQRMRISVERPLTITLGDISKVATVVDALIAVGVNRFDGIGYDVADRADVENEALVAAIERAKRKAELMARTLGVSLGPVVEVQETRTPVFRPMMMAVAESARAKSADYDPGSMSVDAGVVVTWQIAR